MQVSATSWHRKRDDVRQRNPISRILLLRALAWPPTSRGYKAFDGARKVRWTRPTTGIGARRARDLDDQLARRHRQREGARRTGRADAVRVSNGSPIAVAESVLGVTVLGPGRVVFRTSQRLLAKRDGKTAWEVELGASDNFASAQHALLFSDGTSAERTGC